MQLIPGRVQLIATATLAAFLLAVSGADAMSVKSSHRAVGKPSAPVDVRFILPDKLTAGVPIVIAVDVGSGIDADVLELQWRPSAGLVLGATPNPDLIAAPVKDRRYRRSVTLLASSDGEYFLGVLATLRNGSAQQTRAVSLRLNVGVVPARKKPAASTDAHQRPIESMPAQESVPK